MSHLHGNTALHPLKLHDDAEDSPIQGQEGRESRGEGMGFAAGDRRPMSALDEVNKREKSDGSHFDTSEADSMRPVAVEVIDAFDLGNEHTNVPAHPFSPAWIEEEALALLGTIQKDALAEKITDRSKVLLAGYGFGGIVIKQVLVTSSKVVLDLTS